MGASSAQLPGKGELLVRKSKNVDCHVDQAPHEEGAGANAWRGIRCFWIGKKGKKGGQSSLSTAKISR